jgi:hypothetical protein
MCNRKFLNRFRLQLDHKKRLRLRLCNRLKSTIYSVTYSIILLKFAKIYEILKGSEMLWAKLKSDHFHLLNFFLLVSNFSIICNCQTRFFYPITIGFFFNSITITLKKMVIVIGLPIEGDYRSLIISSFTWVKNLAKFLD